MEHPVPDSLGFLLHDAARLVRRRFDVRAAELGLSSAQWRLLVHLIRLGQATQARLAERLEVEPISVSRLVERMEDQGWVRRARDPADRRARIVIPTDKTWTAFQDGRAIAETVYADALAGLPPETRAQLMDCLRRIVRNLSDTLPPE